MPVLAMALLGCAVAATPARRADPRPKHMTPLDEVVEESIEESAPSVEVVDPFEATPPRGDLVDPFETTIAPVQVVDAVEVSRDDVDDDPIVTAAAPPPDALEPCRRRLAAELRCADRAETSDAELLSKAACLGADVGGAIAVQSDPFWHVERGCGDRARRRLGRRQRVSASCPLRADFQTPTATMVACGFHRASDCVNSNPKRPTRTLGTGCSPPARSPTPRAS